MTEGNARTSYDGILTYNVTAPISSGAFTQILNLLTQAQQAEISANRVTQRMEMYAASAFDFETGTPGTANLGTLSPNSNAQHVVANQKPNEVILCPTPELAIYLRSSGAAQIVQLTFYFSNKDTN